MEDHAGDVAAAHRDRHVDRGLGELRVRILLTHREAEQAPRVEVLDRSEEQWSFVGVDLLEVTAPLDVRRVSVEVATHQVGRAPRPLVRPGQAPVVPLGSSHQAFFGHDPRDGVLRHPPARLPQILHHPRAAIGPIAVIEDLAHRRGELVAAPLAWRGWSITPLVEPRLADLKHPARERVRNTMVGPLGGDERCHAHRVASLTHRTTDRLRTSRSISSSATRFRSRTSSA